MSEVALIAGKCRSWPQGSQDLALPGSELRPVGAVGCDADGSAMGYG